MAAPALSRVQHARLALLLLHCTGAQATMPWVANRYEFPGSEEGRRANIHTLWAAVFPEEATTPDPAVVDTLHRGLVARATARGCFVEPTPHGESTFVLVDAALNHPDFESIGCMHRVGKSQEDRLTEIAAMAAALHAEGGLPAIPCREALLEADAAICAAAL